MTVPEPVEQIGVDALVVGNDGKAHLPDDGPTALCGTPAGRFMHPSESHPMCGWCAAVAFGWN